MKRKVILSVFDKNIWNAGLPATPLGIQKLLELCVLSECMLF